MTLVLIYPCRTRAYSLAFSSIYFRLDRCNPSHLVIMLTRALENVVSFVFFDLKSKVGEDGPLDSDARAQWDLMLQEINRKAHCDAYGAQVSECRGPGRDKLQVRVREILRASIHSPDKQSTSRTPYSDTHAHPLRPIGRLFDGHSTATQAFRATWSILKESTTHVQS